MDQSSYDVLDRTLDTVLLYDYQIKYSDEKFKIFLKPLMEQIIKEDLLINRAISVIKDHEVSLKGFPQGGWDEMEKDRFYPKTYLKTLDDLLFSVFTIEVCDQITGAIS